MAYEDLKDLERRTASDKVLRGKAFNIAKNPRYDGSSMVYNFFDKKSKVSNVSNNEIKQSLQLAGELHKPIIRNFKKRAGYYGLKIIFGELI